MIVFFNGQFLPESRALVSVFDRGFLYGDALFETVPMHRGRPFLWEQRLARLAQGLKFLQISLPIAPAALRAAAIRLTQRNNLPDAILRLTVSRGVAARGYSPKNAASPAVVMTLHPLPNPHARKLPRWRVITSSFRVPLGDPLTAFKTANKLPQVLARAEADAARADEALLLNAKGFLAEAAASNLFWIQRGAICTPPLTAGALPGVTRALIFDLCRALNLRAKEVNARPAVLPAAAGAFLTLSSLGIVEIESLDGTALRSSPLVKEIWRAYRQRVAADA